VTAKLITSAAEIGAAKWNALANPQGLAEGINPFDQFGVELGKSLATDLSKRRDSLDFQGLDASTAALLRQLT